MFHWIACKCWAWLVIKMGCFDEEPESELLFDKNVWIFTSLNGIAFEKSPKLFHKKLSIFIVWAYICNCYNNSLIRQGKYCCCIQY